MKSVEIRSLVRLSLKKNGVYLPLAIKKVKQYL
jgi:hypothetical protein